MAKWMLWEGRLKASQAIKTASRLQSTIGYTFKASEGSKFWSVWFKKGD